MAPVSLKLDMDKLNTLLLEMKRSGKKEAMVDGMKITLKDCEGMYIDKSIYVKRSG